MMYFVYILKSLHDKNLYIGSTKDLKRRLNEHVTGKVGLTKCRLPLELRYYEAFTTEKEARTRESKLKERGSAHKELLRRIKSSIEN